MRRIRFARTGLGSSRTFRASGEHRVRILPWTMGLMAAGLLGFAFVPSFWPALVVLMVGGAGYLLASTAWTTALQEEKVSMLRYTSIASS